MRTLGVRGDVVINRREQVAGDDFTLGVLDRFPPPDDVTIQLFEWDTTSASPCAPPCRTCSLSAVTVSPSPIASCRSISPGMLMDDAAPATPTTLPSRRRCPVGSNDGIG
jgi:hypothetical protein